MMASKKATAFTATEVVDKARRELESAQATVEAARARLARCAVLCSSVLRWVWLGEVLEVDLFRRR